MSLWRDVQLVTKNEQAMFSHLGIVNIVMILFSIYNQTYPIFENYSANVQIAYYPCLVPERKQKANNSSAISRLAWWARPPPWTLPWPGRCRSPWAGGRWSWRVKVEEKGQIPWLGVIRDWWRLLGESVDGDMSQTWAPNCRAERQYGRVIVTLSSPFAKKITRASESKWELGEASPPWAKGKPTGAAHQARQAVLLWQGLTISCVVNWTLRTDH